MTNCTGLAWQMGQNRELGRPDGPNLVTSTERADRPDEQDLLFYYVDF